MIFSPSSYSRLRLRLKRKYARDLTKTLNQFKAHRKNALGQWIQENKVELEAFGPVRWYFLRQLQFYLSLASLIPKLSSDPEEFSRFDNDAFERWNQSEFADVFLKTLNRGKGIRGASEVALSHLESHLLTLGARHILREDKRHPSYRIQTSLGEYGKGNKPGRLLETTLHLEGKELRLQTKTLREMKDFSGKIEAALKVIRHHSPEAWERFKAFTEVIVPIKQEEFVSYSHQELPGHSMINLYDRDFVDLLDDLLHENGHHHLNYYLNLGKVIDEPIDCIYYSPWRRTLRPLRGIYHAYFTFFWAFDLFSTMACADNMDTPFHQFTASEKEKILWRAVEEYHMLEYTYQDLSWARRRGLISDLGWNFITEQKKLVLRKNKKVQVWERQLREHKKQLSDLKKTLRFSEKQFQKKKS